MTDKRTVAIVGFAGSSRELVKKEPETTEIWGLNNGYTFMTRNADVWFEIHGHEGRDAYRAQHWQRLEDMGIPIYALHPPAGVKNARELDYSRICQELSVEPYFTNSIAYMIAVAIDEGVDDLRIYGVDMATGTEYEKQRACCEYWIGIARGRGMAITIPDVSPICRGLLYGVDRDDGFSRRMILDQLSTLTEQQKEALIDYHSLRGGVMQITQLVEALQDFETENGEITRDAMHGIVSELRKELVTKEKDAMCQYHCVDGAIQATRNLTRRLFLPDMAHSEIDYVAEGLVSNGQGQPEEVPITEGV